MTIREVTEVTNEEKALRRNVMKQSVMEAKWEPASLTPISALSAKTLCLYFVQREVVS